MKPLQDETPLASVHILATDYFAVDILANPYC